MRPEGGRIELETMEDVRIAERGIMLYYKVRTQEDIQNVQLAKDESALPMVLSHNRTKQIREALGLVIANEVELGPLKPEVARAWNERLEGRFEQVPDGQGAISITDKRKQHISTLT